VTPDPKWLEILKLSSDDRLGVAAFCGLFLLIRRWGWLPPVPDWLVLSAWIGLLLFGCLFLVALLPALFVGVEVLVLWLRQRRKGPWPT
jgi:hypothetical protein